MFAFAWWPVIGLALLALAVILLVIRSRNRSLADHREQHPARTMTVYDGTFKDAPGTMVDISGTIVGPPTLQTPLSKRACAVWELALYRVTYSEGETGYDTLWATGRAGDLVVEYDVRRDISGDLAANRPVHKLGPGGRVTIEGSRISLKLEDDPRKVMPGVATFASAGYQPADPAVLREVGLPAALLAEVTANPGGFRLREGAYTTGDHVRLSHSPQAGPAYHVIPLSPESFQAFGFGCLRGILLTLAVAAIVAAIAVTAPLLSAQSTP